MGFTRDLVERVSALHLDGVPSEALDVGKSSLLDTLGVALAGRGERVVHAVEGFVADDSSTGSAGVWGTSRKTSASRAALVNGTAAHALDYDDVCWAMNAHPSAVLWPAALAVGESIGASGKDVLASYIAGFEAAADVGATLGTDHYAAGFHPTATIGTLAAAVVTGRLLRLDPRALARAIGIACSEVAGSRINFGTDTKPLHAGFAAQAGIVAASLAMRGVTAREDAIEGSMGLVDLYRGKEVALRARELALLDPGVELKPYPSCRFTHRVVDAALAIRSRHPTEQAESIECTVDPFSLSIVTYSRPANGLEGKFSMEYAAAAAWLDGRVGVDTFKDERVARSDIQALLERTNVVSGSKDSETVRVWFTGGGSDEETVHVAKGSPARPLTRAERATKFLDGATPALGDGARLVPAAVQRVEALSDIRELCSLLVPGPK
jgi:2-methylcitrate dehydratase PrpD